MRQTVRFPLSRLPLYVLALTAMLPFSARAQDYYQAESREAYEKSGAGNDVAATGSAYGFAPRLHGDFLFELEDDWTVNSDNNDDERNDLYGTVESYLRLGLTDRIGIETGLVFEPVRDLDPDENGFFDNEGLYVEQLKLVWQGESLGAFIGKYNPTFGTAWYLAPGIWGTDFAEDYELTERLGFGGNATWATPEWGRHTLNAGTFFADTTFLSDSWLESRGDLDESDGGASNTQSLSSFSITLDGQDVGAVAGLGYHLGFRRQAEGDADTAGDNETGWVAGATYEFRPAERYQVNLMGEYADFSNFDAGPDDATYLTAGATLTIDEKWNAAVSWTGRDTDLAAGGSNSDHLFQLSGGYAFDNGVQIDAGWRNASESNDSSNALGARLAYEWDF
ncbi:MAG TPA: hypothetical protein PKX87_04365 [Alphaproteobacteria bacterium]|nr:hypothetical protein [Alphaproteobacteria bacterium]